MSYHLLVNVYTRVEWFFWEKSWALARLCQILKYHLLELPTYVAQDSENFVCKPKIFKNIFKGCIWNKICSLVCLKEKTEEKLKLLLLPSPWTKPISSILGPKKNIKQNLSSNYKLFFKVTWSCYFQKNCYVMLWFF